MEIAVIAGAGPAGLTASIYAARAGLAPLVLEGPVPGGQLTVSEAVENYPGFPEPVTGSALMARCREQAQRFGVRFSKCDVEAVWREGDVLTIRTPDGDIETQALVIATGAEARRLGVPGETQFCGRGVSGCATCDGAFFEDRNVVVVGGGNTAMQDALLLSRIAARVTIVHRRDRMRAEACEVERVKRLPNVEWMVPWVVEQIMGADVVDGIVAGHRQSGETRRIPCDGVFVAIGHTPRSGPFVKLVETDPEGYVRVRPGSAQTSTPGVFACGDVCDAVYKQAIVAAAQGCMAAMDVQRYIGKET
jgi:thioredoxin reductase (NADPH)